MAKKTFYNEELNTTEEYSEVWKYELMRVKDISDLIVHNHYWKDSRGELWLDFDDPMRILERPLMLIEIEKDSCNQMK